MVVGENDILYVYQVRYNVKKNMYDPKRRTSEKKRQDIIRTRHSSQIRFVKGAFQLSREYIFKITSMTESNATNAHMYSRSINRIFDCCVHCNIDI